MKRMAKYPSDLTARQWQIIRQLLPKRSRRGRPRIDRRRILNGIRYVVRSGCQWRMLPTDFPKWKTVYGIFWTWRNDGAWDRIHAALSRPVGERAKLREKVRRATGKKSTPTAAILDSQSIRIAEGGAERGYDAGKKITGRKRHLAVDTLGLVLSVVVQSASWQDHDGACFVLLRLQESFRRITVWRPSP